jgi:hypothetical protein
MVDGSFSQSLGSWKPSMPSKKARPNVLFVSRAISFLKNYCITDTGPMVPALMAAGHKTT